MTKAFLELSLSVLSTTRITAGSKHSKLAEVTKHEEQGPVNCRYSLHVEGDQPWALQNFGAEREDTQRQTR